MTMYLLMLRSFRCGFFCVRGSGVIMFPRLSIYNDACILLVWSMGVDSTFGRIIHAMTKTSAIQMLLAMTSSTKLAVNKKQ